MFELILNGFLVPWSHCGKFAAAFSEEFIMKWKQRFDVEDGDFKKSSWSKNNPKTCVMVAVKPAGVAIRDSKDPTKATMFFNHAEWDAFLAGAKNGEFDRKS